MSRALRVELELPDDAFGEGFDESTFTSQVKEVVVMRLLKEHRVSQGKAAELLGITRHDCLDLMAQYDVPVLDLSREELQKELAEVDRLFRTQ